MLRGLGAGDRVALYSYDQTVKRVVSFDESVEVPRGERERLVLSRFDQLGPTWGKTSLGAALIRAADDLDAAVDKEQPLAGRQVVVLSDMQNGSDIETLQAYRWPDAVLTTVQLIRPDKTSNASLQLLDDLAEQEDQRGFRVRITNAEDSQQQQFQVVWASRDGQPLGDPRSISVPPGESRVLCAAPLPADQTASELRLTGDDHDFDNRHYLVPPRRQETRLLYVGSEEADDPQHMLYYLQRGLTNDPWHPIQISVADRNADWLPKLPRQPSGSTDPRQAARTVVESNATSGQPVDPTEENTRLLAPHLVIVTERLREDELQRLGTYLSAGGVVLYVVHGSDTTRDELAPLLGQSLTAVERVEPIDYAMLSEIDFQHPLFSPFANPRYNDFSKIHFWAYNRLQLAANSDLRVLARFDNGDPALLELNRDPGRLWVLTSGWHPDDSELARSSKFVPLISGMIHQRDAFSGSSFDVYQPVPRPADSMSERTTVVGPDGTVSILAENQVTFDDTSLPGIYSVRYGETEYDFAVNLASSESKTAPLDVAQLEQRGVHFGKHETEADLLAARRQMRDIELEAQQSYWQWLIAAALVVIALESLVAGRRTLRSPEEAIA